MLLASLVNILLIIALVVGIAVTTSGFYTLVECQKNNCLLSIKYSAVLIGVGLGVISSSLVGGIILWIRSIEGAVDNDDSESETLSYTTSTEDLS